MFKAWKNLGKSGWFKLTMKRQGLLEKNQENKDICDYIIGYTIFYFADNLGAEGYKAKYRVAPAGKNYLKWEYNDEDGGAGDDVNGVDRLQLTLEKAL